MRPHGATGRRWGNRRWRSGSDSVSVAEFAEIRVVPNRYILETNLLTFRHVIQTFSEGGSAHVNYRDSKLTRILQPSLPGNAGMAVICCATSGEGRLQETRSTLQFASCAKKIKTRPIVNKMFGDTAQLWRVSRELASLKRQQAEAGISSVEKAERSTKIRLLNRLFINLAPVSEARELHLGVSPRYRRNKLSHEKWCPGEGDVPLPRSSPDTNQLRQQLSTHKTWGNSESSSAGAVRLTPRL